MKKNNDNTYKKQKDEKRPEQKLILGTRSLRRHRRHADGRRLRHRGRDAVRLPRHQPHLERPEPDRCQFLLAADCKGPDHCLRGIA